MLTFQLFISLLSGPFMTLLALLLLGVILQKIHDNKDFYIILFTSTLALSITYTLKYLLKIPRPDNMFVTEYDYRFPSGHATMAGIVMTLGIYYAHKHIKNKILRNSFYILSIFWYMLVSYSRLYLHVHYPIDIIVGGIIGVTSTILVITIFKHIRYYR